MRFKNILFPVDFSERSRAIVPHVRAACDRFGAALTLLHVVHMPAMAYGAIEAPMVFEFPLDAMKTDAEKCLAEFAESAFPGLAVKLAVDDGEPAYCITELARAFETDLIMMPTRGHGRFRATLLGSVTAKTLHDALCAVWTEAHCGSGPPQHTEWRTIVAGIDIATEGRDLIHAAAYLTAGTSAKVYLAHAVPAPEGGVERYIGHDFTEFLKQDARERIAAMQKVAGTNFGVCVEGGSIADVVSHAAVTYDADLVLIGRGLLPSFAGGLRSHVYKIVRDMPCPVLSV